MLLSSMLPLNVFKAVSGSVIAVKLCLTRSLSMYWFHEGHLSSSVIQVVGWLELLLGEALRVVITGMWLLPIIVNHVLSQKNLNVKSNIRVIEAWLLLDFCQPSRKKDTRIQHSKELLYSLISAPSGCVHCILAMYQSVRLSTLKRTNQRTASAFFVLTRWC